MEIYVSLSGEISGLVDMANLTRTDKKGAAASFSLLTTEQLRSRMNFKTWLTKYEDEGRAIEDLAHVCATRPDGHKLFWAVLIDAFAQDYNCLYDVLQMENARAVFGTFPHFLSGKALKDARQVFEDPDFEKCILDLRASVPKDKRPKKGAKPVALKK